MMDALNYEFLAWWFWAIAMLNVFLAWSRVFRPGIAGLFCISVTAIGLLVSWLFQ